LPRQAGKCRGLAAFQSIRISKSQAENRLTNPLPCFMPIYPGALLIIIVNARTLTIGRLCHDPNSAANPLVLRPSFPEI
jgi:hypothetical protein